MEWALHSALLAAGAFVAYGNGANDISKTIATLLGSGEASYRKAVTCGAIASGLGAIAAAFLAQKMVKTFAQGYLADTAQATLPFALAVALGAVGWLALATRTGMPVSTTHSLLGAAVVCGAVAFGPGNVSWAKVTEKFALPLLLSPLVSLVVAWIILWGIRPIFRLCNHGACRTSHWISSMTSCFARSFNDIPKIVGILSLYYLADGSPIPGIMLGSFAFLGAAATAGALMSGLRVTETLAYRVAEMDHDEGLAANLTTGLLVIATGLAGLPVSTTHVSSGAIIAIGLHKGLSGVQWGTVRNMALAWVVTLPVSGLMSACLYSAWARPRVGIPATAALLFLGLLVTHGLRNNRGPAIGSTPGLSKPSAKKRTLFSRLAR